MGEVRSSSLMWAREGISDKVVFEQKPKKGEQTMQQVSKEIMESIYPISNKHAQQLSR